MGDPDVPVAQVIDLTREVRRSRRKRAVRAKTISSTRTTKRELRHLRLVADEDLRAVGPVERPRTRGDCAHVERPCPFVSCAHHLYLDVTPKTRAVKINYPDIGAEDLPPEWSCALDVADRGGATLEDVGEFTNVTRERVRQVELKALGRLAALRDVAALREHIGDGTGRASVNRAGTEGSLVRAVAKARAVEQQPAEHEERDEDLERARAARADVLEAARYGSIVGHLMLTFQLPLRVALERASEYVEEFPGELPEGCELVLPKKKAQGPWWLGELVTPPERRTEPPKSVEHLVPRERGGEPDLLDERARMGGFEDERGNADTLVDRLMSENRPRATRSRALTQKSTPATAPEKDRNMSTYPKGQRSPKTDMNCERITRHLKENGPTARGDLMSSLGIDEADINVALRALAEDGTAEVRGMARAARWSIKGDERAAAPRTIADVAKKAAKKQAKRAKANGKSNGHASVRMVHFEASGAASGVQAALDALAAAMTQEFEKKMDAIKTLRGG